MAAKTFNPAGASANWSDVTSWGGSLPVSGDTCTITAGKTCIFDVDQSGMAAGLAGLLINGTLQCKATAGTYYLKMDGVSGHNITFGAAGQLLAGSAGTPLPVAAIFTIDLNGLSAVNSSSAAGSAGVALYCTQPTYAGVVLNAGVAIAATSLPYTNCIRASDYALIATDLSADTYWTASVTALLNIDNINKQKDSEARNLSSISSSAITVSSGLTNAKVTGTYVWLTWRNVRVIGYTGTAGALQNTGSGTFFLQCELFGPSGNVFVNGVGLVFAGIAHGGGQMGNTSTYGGTYAGIISGLSAAGIENAGGFVFSGYITGSNSGIMSCYGFHALPGSVIAGCGNGFNLNREFRHSGLITGNNVGILASSGTIVGGACTNNSIDIDQGTRDCVFGYQATLSSAIPVNNYNLAGRTNEGWQRVVMWDYGNVADAYKAWMYAGTVVNDTGTLPSPNPQALTYTFKHIFERNTTPLFTDIPIWLPANTKVQIVAYMKKDTNAMTETPSVQLIAPGTDPMLVAGAAVLASATMNDDLLFQTITLTYTSARAQAAIVRFRGRHASGNFWANAVVSCGGGISKGRAM